METLFIGPGIDLRVNLKFSKKNLYARINSCTNWNVVIKIYIFVEVLKTKNMISNYFKLS